MLHAGAEGGDPGGGLEEAMSGQGEHPPAAAVEPALELGFGRHGLQKNLGGLIGEGGVVQVARGLGLRSRGR